MQSVKLLWNLEWVEKHERQLLAILLILAVCVVARNVIAHLSGDAFSRADGSWTIAQNLVNGQGYSACLKSYFPLCGPDNQQTAMRPPIPVLLMAAAMRFSGSHISGVVIQGLLYLGTQCIIYASLKEFDRRCALLAALLWVISIPAIRSIDTDSGDMAAAFFFSAGMFYFQRGRQKGGVPPWLLAGSVPWYRIPVPRRHFGCCRRVDDRLIVGTQKEHAARLDGSGGPRIHMFCRI